jgi:hypothetical protein
MKRTILSVIILVVGCAICSLVTYRLAYNAGFARAKELQKGTFVGALGVLEKLRAGDVAEGTRRVETMCFLSATLLYGDPDYRDHFITKTFAPELIHYRATYRTNRTEWTPMEEELETYLAQWR